MKLHLPTLLDMEHYLSRSLCVFGGVVCLGGPPKGRVSTSCFNTFAGLEIPKAMSHHVWPSDLGGLCLTCVSSLMANACTSAFQEPGGLVVEG